MGGLSDVYAGVITEWMRNQYEEIHTAIANADRNKISFFIGSFEDLCNEIIGDLMVENISEPRCPELLIGTDIGEYIENNIIGAVVTLYYSDGSTAEHIVTRDMIREIAVDTSKLGDGFIVVSFVEYICHTTQYVNYYVKVRPDMTNAEEVGTFVTDAFLLNYENATATAVLYDNGYVVVTVVASDESRMFEYVERNGFVVINRYGTPIIFAVDSVQGEAHMYVPASAPDYIFTYYDDKGEVTIEVYEFCGNDEYIVRVGKEYYDFDITTYATIDYVSGTFYCYYVLDETLDLDLDRCVVHRNLGTIKTDVASYIAENWQGLINMYEVTERQFAQYNDIIFGIENAQTEEAVYRYRETFDRLCKEIFYGGRPVGPSVEHVAIDGNERLEAYIGESFEDFLRRAVLGKELYVYYSNGECEYYTLSIEMILADEFDTSELGSTCFTVMIPVDGEQLRYDIWVEVIPDMSNAEEVASYRLDPAIIEGGESEEIFDVRLYSNGFLAMMLKGEVMTYLAYSREGDMIILYMEEGAAMIFGVENGMLVPYEPEDSVMITLTFPTEVKEGIFENTTFTVYGTYNGRGEYVTVITQEFNGEPAMRMTTFATVDLDNSYFEYPGGAFEIASDNTLVCLHTYARRDRVAPTCTENGREEIWCSTCDYHEERVLPALGGEHEFVDGQCIKCGEWDNGDTDDEEFIQQRSKLLNSTKTRWSDIESKYTLTEEQKSAYWQDLHKRIGNATTYAELESLSAEFDALCNEVVSNF